MARKKPAKKSPELVTTCDQCGKSLGRTCQRASGSAVCSAGCGIEISHVGSSTGETLRFFCSSQCKNLFREKCNQETAT